MHRRRFLFQSAALAVGAVGGGYLLHGPDGRPATDGRVYSLGEMQYLVPHRPPAYSIIPVVGDGKWIWTKPPEKDRGYLEPRDYQVKFGVHLLGTGDARSIKGTTTVPMPHPEQEIEDVEVESKGCRAGVRKLKDGAAQLALAAPNIRAGQVISATATYWLTISKQYFGFHRDQFPYQQDPPSAVRKAHLGDSPGISTSCDPVEKLAAELTDPGEHPWDKAKRFQEWVPKNIRARIGPYTSVRKALKNKVGDCEERSAVFVALCRAVGIPARLVWVPNHNWAEMYLHDEDGKGQWIPVHTSCYPWFGWVGAHELVIQKGDRIQVPERHKRYRLVEDWAQWSGKQPRVRWTAELIPLPERTGGDPGPGARQKDEKGEWKIIGEHAMNKHMRR